MNKAICLAVGLAASFLPAMAFADEGDDEAQRYASVAVQNRQYGSTQEITAHVGLLPMDAFTKGMSVGGTYTLHISDLFAWEIVNGFYSVHLNTSLRKDLAAFDLAPTPFEVVNWALTSNLVFKPIYWKGAWLNHSVIHGEIQFVVGGGYSDFTRSQRIVIDAGIGFRVFLTRAFAVRLDVRYMGFLNTTISQGLNLNNDIWTSLGLSLSL